MSGPQEIPLEHYLDADDILRPGETSAMRLRTRYGTNGDGRMGSGTGAVKVGNFDIVGQLNGHWSNEYEDGGGNIVPFSGDTTRSGMAKARWRPAVGHQFTGTFIDYNSEFVDTTATGGSHPPRNMMVVSAHMVVIATYSPSMNRR